MIGATQNTSTILLSLQKGIKGLEKKRRLCIFACFIKLAEARENRWVNVLQALNYSLPFALLAGHLEKRDDLVKIDLFTFLD